MAGVRSFTSMKSVLVITLIDTIILGSISFLINLLTGNVAMGLWYIFLIVPTVACTLAVSISIPLTSLIAIETFRRGLNPDILVYPILASVNDIVVTVFFVITVFMVLAGNAFTAVLIGLFFVILGGVGYIVAKTFDNEFFRQTIKEGTFVVVMSSIFGSVNGVLLSNLSGSIENIPGLLTLYPALTNALGNVGSIIGSRITTSIALGYARSFEEELRDAGRSIILVEIPAFFMHIVFAFIAYLLTVPVSPDVSLMRLLGIALSSNLLGFGLVALFALYSAYLAFERGLNPDNVVIPAITSVSDTTATLTITPAIWITKLLGL